MSTVFTTGALGIVALTHQTIAYADAVAELARGYGVTMGFALQFQNALQQSGVEADAAGKIIGKGI